MLFPILLIIRLCKANDSYRSLNFAGDVLDGKSINLASNPRDAENVFLQLTSGLFDGSQSNFLMHGDDSKSAENASNLADKGKKTKNGESKQTKQLREEDGESSEKTTGNTTKLNADNETNTDMEDEDSN